MKFIGDEAPFSLARSWRQILLVFTDSIEEIGGLPILWNPNLVTLDNFFSTPWSILARYRVLVSDKMSIVTNLYGPPTPREKDTFLRNIEGPRDII
jgi:hypothetical protein